MRLVKHRVHHVDVTLPFEWQFARRHFVEHDAKRKDVAAMIGPLSLRLLGRHVRRSSNRRAHPGQLVLRFDCLNASLVSQQLRKSEVEHLGLTARGDDYVARFDVAMHDTLRVSCRKGVAHLQRDREQTIQAERLSADYFFQRPARHVLHSDEILAVDFGDFIYGADVRVIERGGQTRFPQEALPGLLFQRQLRRQQL